MSGRRETGIAGEEQAVRYLKDAGLRILDRNVRCPFGEIDIVARDRDHLVFIEVKRRRTASYGLPAEAVGRDKQARIVKSALRYVKERHLTGESIRFDVLAIGPGDERVELVRDAFRAEGPYTY